MSLLRDILYLLFIPILEFLILISSLVCILFIIPIFVLFKKVLGRLSKKGSPHLMTLLILLGIMSISCRTIEISSPESISTSIKLAEKIEDPIKREVISASLKDMKATIETQSEIIEKYQKDLDKARKDAEEAQQAKGLVDGIVTIFWAIIALAGIYFIIKIVKRMGFV